MTREEAVKALTDCRERINAIDRRLLALLNERTRIVEQIGRIKRECKMPVYEPKREEEVLRNIQEHNAGPMPHDSARRIFERIIDEMRTLQRMRMGSTRDGGAK
jgi:chorismate mutase-like protein